MDIGGIWNDLSYLDGILFTLWIGIIYIGKKAIDANFEQRKNG